MIAYALNSAKGSALCLEFQHIRLVTTWHRIVHVLKNLAQLGWRIELGPLGVAIVEDKWVQTEFVADSG